MGDIAAMQSIDRVMERHGDELVEETLAAHRPFLDALGVVPERATGLLVNELTELVVDLVALDQQGRAIERDGVALSIPLRHYDIAELAERFPDCDVGW